MSADRPEDELPRLRRATPPLDERFSDELMRRLATRPLPAPAPALTRAWRWLRAPQPLRVRPIALVALSGLALLAAGLLRRAAPAPVPVAAPLAAAAAPEATVWVRFTLPAQAAHRVSVAGDFNGWRPDATPLERGADGVWRATVPLGAGRWSYSFVVDGQWVEDAAAEAYREDGFGGRNAIVRVGG